LRLHFQKLPLLILIGVVFFNLTGCNSDSSRQKRPLTVQEQRGRDLFQSNCAICHSPYKREPLQGPPLVGVFRKPDLPSGMPATDEHVRETVKTGRRNMPPFQGVLDDQQINDLLAFLHTL
jgi:mono/diheme cytochrome c family protein